MKFKTDPDLKASKIDTIVPYPLAKRVFDFCLALLLLVILSPLFFVLFIAAKIESIFKAEAKGPFIYIETRISRGQPFKFYKIRIYKMSALKQTLEEVGIVHTKRVEKDPTNITTLGKILKKFYLDELPQLVNILKGEMSFVGTRPWNSAEFEREIALGIYRKKVLKAGITGLVQITKGTHRQYLGGDRALDDCYIAFCRTHTAGQIFLFDLKILYWTIIKFLKGEGL